MATSQSAGDLSQGEVTMVAVKLAKSGDYQRAEPLRDALRQACPGASDVQIREALLALMRAYG
jgi:hypothetical protein